MIDGTQNRGRRAARGLELVVLLLGLWAVACSSSGSANSGSRPGAGGASGLGSGSTPSFGATGFGAAGFGATTGSSGSAGLSGFSTDSGSATPPLDGGSGAGTRPPYVPPPTNPTPVSVNECPGSLDAATAKKLAAGTGASAPGTLLYPYDGTIFPVGLPSPTFQWSGQPPADAVYLHLKSKFFEYKGCFGANPASQLAVPQTTWDKAAYQSTGPGDPLTVEITTSSGGAISGPLHESITFALGTLKGYLYYNTYTSPQAGLNGAVMRIHLGDTKPEVFLTDFGLVPTGPCWSCHSLSANGTVLVAQHHQYPGGPYYSASFDLVSNPSTRPPPTVELPSSTAEMGLGAVFPDGSKVLTMGSPADSTLNPSFPDGLGNVPAMIGPKESMLLDTKTGQVLPMKGWNVQYAKMPSFSPDGSMVVFNWHEDSNGHSLGVANFDTKTNTTSNVRVLYRNATLFPGWPWITPDNKEVVFVLGNTPDYVSGYPGRIGIAASDLYTVDVATGVARQLARANGYAKSGAATYLPNPGRDEHLEFFPTITPIASGGYFWVFFTSRRTYGNTITQLADDPTTKKIWVTAFDIRSGALIDDPSHPPFYLPGQEDVSGNIRAFSTLEPCRMDGASCQTGVDCCDGRCTNGKCGLPPPPTSPPGQPPGQPPSTCSQIDERCTTANDCCSQAAACINHFCALVAPS